MIANWFGWRAAEPAIVPAAAADAAALSAIHAASFARGWSEHEFESLLIDPQVLAHRARLGRRVVGFALSRQAADEAEILSIAVSPERRRSGIGRRLLELHLRELAGRGTRRVFLEVDEGNAAARPLYARLGFRDVGRRPGYYGGPSAPASAALVLRRDLA